jgi:hypothetical protein
VAANKRQNEITPKVNHKMDKNDKEEDPLKNIQLDFSVDDECQSN